MIPIPDLVINRVNTLGSDQPKLMTFTDRHGRLVGDIDIPGVDADEPDDVGLPDLPTVIDDAIEIPGVDDGLHNPQNIEINDLEPAEADQAPIEVETEQEETVSEVEAATTTPVEQPAAQLPELRRSTRTKVTTNKGYVPSMSGSRYAYAVTQLGKEGVMNPDAHMFVQNDFYQAKPDVVAAVMTQLSLKAGLREWGVTAHTAVKSEMKQLHMRETF